MNAAATKWVDLLESGKYKQGREQLRTRNGYCCLGVACDMTMLGTWVKEDGDKGDWMYKAGEGRGTRTNSGHLPGIVRDRLGLSTSVGTFRMSDAERTALKGVLSRKTLNVIQGRMYANSSCSLACLNDEGVSFAEIAKVIRAKPKGLFKKAK